MSRRDLRFTENVAHIRKLQPTAVFVGEAGVDPTGDFSLHVEVRVAEGEDALLQRKALAPQRELGRNRNGRWNVAASREVHALPVERCGVQRTFDIATGFHRELKG